MNRLVLGRGLDALIPHTVTATKGSFPLQSIDINSIIPNKLQPRQTFTNEALEELSRSIKADGLLQPIVVTPRDGGYMLVAGERRWRAARIAGFTQISAAVLPTLDDKKLLQMALVENLQREDLNPIEAAHAYRELMERFRLTQSEVADMVGKSRPAVANSMRLLSLPDDIQRLLEDGKLTEGHARAILALDTSSDRSALARQIVEARLTVRQVEDVARQRGKKRRLSPKYSDLSIAQAETTLKRAFGTAVKITPGLKSGRIVIEYYGVTDLTRILDLVVGMGSVDKL